MSQDPTIFRGLATLAVHAGQEPNPATTARAVPIYSTTSYVFHDTEHAANLFALREFGNIYSRLMNPTNNVVEKRLAALDGGAAGLVFASGQAAITASLLTIVHSGQNFISATSLYGGTWTLFTQTFAKLGVEVRFFDPRDPESLGKLVDENTRAVVYRNPRQSQERRAGLQAVDGNCPPVRVAGDRRQHGLDPGPVSPNRARL